VSNGSGSDAGAASGASGSAVVGGSGLRVVANRFARNRLALAGLMVFGLLVLVAVLAVLAPLQVGGTANDNPAFHTNIVAALQGPSAAHPLGTDDVGRDELALILLGTRLSVQLALGTLLLATGLGAAVLALGAVVAGARFATVAHVFAVVSTPLLIVVLLAGTGIVTQQPLLITFGLLMRAWVQPRWWGRDLTDFPALLITLFLAGEVARFSYLLFRSLRPAQPAQPAHAAASAAGRASSIRPALAAVLPVLGPAAVTGLWIAGDAVLVQSILVLYGIGDQPPLEPLSFLVADGATVRDVAPLLFFVPLALMLLFVLSVNVVGFGLRSALRGVTQPR
jgi:peptide/nickel transport system permease protein